MNTAALTTLTTAPRPEAIFGYEAMSSVMAVLREAGSAADNRSTVVHDFFSIRNRDSVLGSYSINVNGDTSLGPFVFSRFEHGKLILMTDADVDGGHIRALLLALFYQEMPGLIEAGKVYVAMPPLYSITWKNKTHWLLDDDALRKFYGRNSEAKNTALKRYKGLGEMKAAELRETTMHPASRVLKQVTLEDSAIAQQVVADLMDESRPEARREFLAQAARLTDLDV